MVAVRHWILLSLLAAAAWTDFRYRKIPNICIASGIVLGIIFMRLPFICTVLGVFPVVFPLFYFRMMGAGDLKLMALICGYMGIGPGALAIGTGLLLGAVYSLFQLWKQNLFKERISYFTAYIRQLIQTKQHVAYYVPERDGTNITMPLAVFLLAGVLLQLYAA